jgi:hypothetical protein
VTKMLIHHRKHGVNLGIRPSRNLVGMFESHTSGCAGSTTRWQPGATICVLPSRRCHR